MKEKTLSTSRRLLNLSALLLVVLLLLEVVIGCLPYEMRAPRVNGRQEFLLSTAAAEQLSALEAEATVYMLVDGGEYAADRELVLYLERVVAAGEKVTLEIVDTRANPEFLALFGVSALSDHSLIVVGEKRYRIIDGSELYFYYNKYFKIQVSAAEYNAALYAYQTGDRSDPSLYAMGESLMLASMYTYPFFDGDALLVNALTYVTKESVPTIAVYRGSGCSPLDAEFARTVKLNCYDVEEISALSELPAACDLLMMHVPTEDLSESEAAALRTYLAAGGELWLNTVYTHTELPRLQEILRECGLSAGEQNKILCEGTSAYVLPDANGNALYPFYFTARPNLAHSYMRGEHPNVRIGAAHELRVDESVTGATPRKLLSTSAQGYRMSTDGTAEEKRQSYVLAATSEKDGATVLWCATSNLFNGALNDSASGGNHSFALTMIERMTDTSSGWITLDAQAMPTASVMVSDATFVIWSVLLVVVLPAVLLFVGWTYRASRKRK